MLSVDEAVQRAKTEMSQLFPDFTERDLRLEEAETPLSAGRWRFTFSAATPEASDESRNALAELLRARRTRKVVELESETGGLVAIKAA